VNFRLTVDVPAAAKAELRQAAPAAATQAAEARVDGGRLIAARLAALDSTLAKLAGLGTAPPGHTAGPAAALAAGPAAATEAVAAAPAAEAAAANAAAQPTAAEAAAPIGTLESLVEMVAPSQASAHALPETDPDNDETGEEKIAKNVQSAELAPSLSVAAAATAEVQTVAGATREMPPSPELSGPFGAFKRPWRFPM
jgi:hypothetical protein